MLYEEHIEKSLPKKIDETIITDLDIYEEFLELDLEIPISIQNFKYIINYLTPEMYRELEKEGTNNYPVLKQKLRDILIRDDKVEISNTDYEDIEEDTEEESEINTKNNLLYFFGLDFEDIEEELQREINKNNKILTVKDLTGDFYTLYLQDQTLFETYLNLVGYALVSDSQIDQYSRVRKPIIPEKEINYIFTMIKPFFNKYNLLSNKDGERTGKIILLSINEIAQKLFEMPYQVCDEEDSRTVLISVSNLLLSLLDYQEGNKKILLETVNGNVHTSDITKSEDAGGVYE